MTTKLIRSQPRFIDTVIGKEHHLTETMAKADAAWSKVRLGASSSEREKNRQLTDDISGRASPAPPQAEIQTMLLPERRELIEKACAGVRKKETIPLGFVYGEGQRGALFIEVGENAGTDSFFRTFSEGGVTKGNIDGIPFAIGISNPQFRDICLEIKQYLDPTDEDIEAAFQTLRAIVEEFEGADEFANHKVEPHTDLLLRLKREDKKEDSLFSRIFSVIFKFFANFSPTPVAQLGKNRFMIP